MLPSGTVVWAIANMTFLRDEGGRPIAWLGQFQDITEGKRSEARLRRLADEDSLTNVANRRSFEDAVRVTLELCERHGIAGALLLIDLDGFKAINDTYGHALGDSVLAAVAGGLRERLRSTDLLARVGGDEFAVLLPATSGEGARRVAEALADRVRATKLAPGLPELGWTRASGSRTSGPSRCRRWTSCSRRPTRRCTPTSAARVRPADAPARAARGARRDAATAATCHHRPMHGKVALVTGGASGIGRATVQRLAAAGCKVVATDVDPAGEQVVAELDGARFEAHDVADEAAWERVIAATLREHDRLDVLVNNAGISRVGAVTDTTLADWRRLMAINLDGVFLGCKHGIAAMRRHGDGGAVVNMSSISGIVGAPMASAYCASKGGVRLLTKSRLALECAGRGHPRELRAGGGLDPGAVRTAIWSTVGLGPDDEAAIAAGQPMGRMAEPKEVADAIAYLASDAARFMTGSELVIDGGFSAG